MLIAARTIAKVYIRQSQQEAKMEKVHKYHHESEATQETKRKRNLAH